jgi:hypothetical protein
MTAGTLLQGMVEVSVEWIEAASELGGAHATLEEVQKCVKEYSKLNLNSPLAEPLRARVSAAQSWLEAAREMYKDSAIQVRPSSHSTQHLGEVDT